jgi:hypothetical protein
MERKLLFGSQLEIIPDIGKTERYTLVGCSISVVNPFVRYDLIQDFSVKMIALPIIFNHSVFS